MVEFIIPGIPVPQARPRAGKIQRGRRKGKTIMYDPETSRDYKSYVSLIAKQHAPKTLLEGNLRAVIKFYRQIPKSTTKKDRIEYLAGIQRPIVKPDIDNYSKSVLDALNGIIYQDDSQVVSLQADKFYSDDPRVELTIYEMDVYQDIS